MKTSAAIIHYAAKPGKCSTIDPNAVYLCDSGAQYQDGTTDTTRTVHFGTPSAKEREMYTRVLKGVINLDETLFPAGTNGYYIDCIARRALWVSLCCCGFRDVRARQGSTKTD